MKRNKITALVLSVVMSLSLMMPSIGVLADETPEPSDTQKTESTETQETKPDEKKAPKETENQEPNVTETHESKGTEKSEPETTETQKSKESETQEPKETENQEPNVTETKIPKETEKREVEETTKAPDDKDGEATVEGTFPEQSVRVSRKNTIVYYGNCGNSGDNLTWTLDSEGTLTITGSGLMFQGGSDVQPWKNVRAEIRTVVISEGSSCNIGNSAFAYCKNLTSVSLTGCYEIGYGAFAECTSLTDIDFPENFSKIGSVAFAGCTSLKSITIPKKVTAIGTDTFFKCTGLTSVTLPSNLTYIESRAFGECINLKSINLPDGLTTISSMAFEGCSSLTSIVIPYNIQSVGSQAFNGCTGLKSVVLNKLAYRQGFPSSLPDNIFHFYYDISYTDDGNGSISGKSRTFGTDVVEFTVNPQQDYTIYKITLSYADKTVELTPNNGKYICTMPDSDTSVNIHAFFKSTLGQNYAITVNNGTSDLAVATVGTTINLTADPAPSNKVFDKWIVVSGNITLADETKTNTDFTMPAEDVEVTATYKDIEYTIKVNNGSATPSIASVGTVINLIADEAPYGKLFDKWVVNDGAVSLTNALSSTTTFTMPAANVEVTATYKAVPSGNFVVKVNHGIATPSSSYPGLVVRVTANDAPAGTEFEKWEVVSGTVIFANVSSAATIFVMPAENVEITAKYKSSLSVKGKTATVKYSKVKKKNQTLAVSKVLTFVDKGQGQLTYAKVSGNSKILINKTTGAITVKKKLKKKTYTVKVKVQASGDESCNPSGWKTVTFKIKVK